MRVLITGTTGLAGSHLAEYLLEDPSMEVHGTIRWRSNREHIAPFEKDLFLHECDLKDPYAVLRLLQDVRPQRIHHLASQSNVASSWNAPRETLINNITAQLNLFEAVRHTANEDLRIHVSGSSEEYGLVHEHELPVRETNPLRPLSPYAVSKVTQDTLAYQYHRSYGLHIVRTRSFNHTGPRQSDVFVASNFARQIVEIEMGLREPVMHVGNLDAQRDFTDIRDVVKAYDMALNECEPGEVYNIGSGKGRSIKHLLKTLLGMSRLIIRIEQDPERMRPSDIPVLVGDIGRFHERTGWVPSIPFQQTLADLLDYWRERLSQADPVKRKHLMARPELGSASGRLEKR